MLEVAPEATPNPFAIYKRTSDVGDDIYAAGYPSYPANFSRDTIKAGILSGYADLLASQLEISARHQGTEDNPLTGERPGKIHHEVPGAQLVGREGHTTYNACDSTALFLIAAEGLSRVDKEAFANLYAKRKSHFDRAVDHILASVGEEDNLYWDRPPEGSDGYSLRVTYWKDSILPHANGKEEPTYPVSFAQAHFIAARSLLSASRMHAEPALAEKADGMFRAGIKAFMRSDGFVVYKDADGELVQNSSDELHSLAYIPQAYADILPLATIRNRAEAIATPYGYVCTPRSVAEGLSDTYHGDKVWVFEQAKIHYGASKFGLLDEAANAAAIAEHIGTGQELFSVTYHEDGSTSLIPEGNDRQLWSVAAAEYFVGKSDLAKTAWL
jgi:glycogen debranching enzyme